MATTEEMDAAAQRAAEDLARRGTMLDPATRDAVARALASANFRYRANSSLSLRGLGPWSQILVIGTAGEGEPAVRLQELGGTAAQETASEDGPVAIVAPEGTDGRAAQRFGILNAASSRMPRTSCARRSPHSSGSLEPLEVVLGEHLVGEFTQLHRTVFENRTLGLAQGVLHHQARWPYLTHHLGVSLVDARLQQTARR